MTDVKDFDYCLSKVIIESGDAYFDDGNIDWKDIKEISREIIDENRWTNDIRKIYKHLPSGRFFALEYEEINCESSEGSADEDSFVVYEVIEEEQVVKVYVQK